MGAVRPSILSPAVNVVIFQWPCGAEPRRRLPRRARPLSLIILVAQPVSSMKINLCGSRLAWPSRQRRRAAATSGRCCSLASTVFFIAEPHAQQKPRDRALAGLDAARQKLDAKLVQRQIGLLLDPFLEPIGVGLKRRAPPARMRLGFGAALTAESLDPLDSRRGCDIEHIGLRPRRPPLLSCTDKTHPKIVRISHRCPRLEQRHNQLLRPVCESLTIRLIREPL